MLHEHRESNKRHHPHGVSSLTTTTFTEEEIQEANRRHDERMGWSPACGNVYTNRRRLPETFAGPAQEVFD
jgi:hypothetical protein